MNRLAAQMRKFIKAHGATYAVKNLVVGSEKIITEHKIITDEGLELIITVSPTLKLVTVNVVPGVSSFRIREKEAVKKIKQLSKEIKTHARANLTRL